MGGDSYTLGKGMDVCACNLGLGRTVCMYVEYLLRGDRPPIVELRLWKVGI